MLDEVRCRALERDGIRACLFSVGSGLLEELLQGPQRHLFPVKPPWPFAFRPPHQLTEAQAEQNHAGREGEDNRNSPWSDRNDDFFNAFLQHWIARHVGCSHCQCIHRLSFCPKLVITTHWRR